MRSFIRHVIGFSGLIVVMFLFGFTLSFFFNLSGYEIDSRWVSLPSIALSLGLGPIVSEWAKK